MSLYHQSTLCTPRNMLAMFLNRRIKGKYLEGSKSQMILTILKQAYRSISKYSIRKFRETPGEDSGNKMSWSLQHAKSHQTLRSKERGHFIDISSHKLRFSNERNWACLVAVRPVQSDGTSHFQSLALGLMFCCYCIEILKKHFHKRLFLALSFCYQVLKIRWPALARKLILGKILRPWKRGIKQKNMTYLKKNNKQRQPLFICSNFFLF